MTGQNHLLLMRESLFSFQRVAKEIPPLQILNDGTATNDEIKKAVRFWGAECVVTGQESLWKALRQCDFYQSLRSIAQAHPLGLKLALLIAKSLDGPHFFTDADILWFRDPLPFVREYLPGVPIAITQERGNSINDVLAKRFCPELGMIPGPNSGCVWINGDLTHMSLLGPMLQLAAETPGFEFNEQTILGILSKRFGVWLPEKFCHVPLDGELFRRTTWAFKKSHFACHYVRFMRDHFFRDALQLDGGWVPWLKRAVSVMKLD